MKKLNAKKCVECGLCKNDCPVYKVLLRETVSPRGKAKLIKKRMAENIMFLCTLCGACTQNCPYNVDLEIEKMRERIAEEGKDPEANNKQTPYEKNKKKRKPLCSHRRGEDRQVWSKKVLIKV